MRLNMFFTALGLAASLGVASAAQAADKPEIKIGYVEGWADSVASSETAAAIISEKLHYPVKLVSVSAGIMWAGVGRGDLDASVSAWLPVTHADYYSRLKSSVVLGGIVEKDAKIGLVVPSYVEAKTVADLKKYKAEFKGVITGIDAGAGVMNKAEKAIGKYDLGYTLAASSGAGMAVALDRAIRAKEAIVVTGWQPHWMFGRYDLRFLDDPKKVFGEAENVHAMMNPGLEAKAPDVVAFLNNFQWKDGQIAKVMVAINDGASPSEAARKWVAENEAQVNGWLGK